MGAASAHMRKWVPLILLASAQFVMTLDLSVMNVSISQIVREAEFDFDEDRESAERDGAATRERAEADARRRSRRPTGARQARCHPGQLCSLVHSCPKGVSEPDRDGDRGGAAGGIPGCSGGPGLTSGREGTRDRARAGRHERR